MVRQREISPVELTRATLDRISAHDSKLNSFITILSDSAMEQAARAEDEISRGRYKGPLHGIPIGVKDIIDVKGAPTTCGSKLRKNFIARSDATVVRKLKNAGAIIIGKNNLSEFAFVGTDDEFKRPNNPWNLDYWPGGSSSGSAVSVAAGLCFGAIGSDTGGSIRYPAAFCGVVGVKPSYGRVSRTGVMPLSHTMDHVGPLARTVADAALLLETISGPDAADPASRRFEATQYGPFEGTDLNGIRIGFDDAYSRGDTEDDIVDATSTCVQLVAAQGADIKNLDLSNLLTCMDYHLDTIAVDAACSHADLIGAPISSYSPALQSLLTHAQTVTAERYARAEHERIRLISFLECVFSDVDCIVCPASTIASKPNAFWDDVLAGVSDYDVSGFSRFACPFNYAGAPTVTLPSGFNREGMPVAVQIVAKIGDERTMLKVASAYAIASGSANGCRPPL